LTCANAAHNLAGTEEQGYEVHARAPHLEHYNVEYTITRQQFRSSVASEDGL